MKKLSILFILMLLLSSVAVCALTSSGAKQDWLDAKKASADARDEHRDAKVEFAADQTPENEQQVIDTGKAVLHKALDEAEAWLVWKQVEAEENEEISSGLRDAIIADVDTNLAKIDDLRTQVDGVSTRFELGVVTLQMIGKYFELVADVARNSGLVWVEIGEKRADKIEEYEEKLREEAAGLSNEDAIVERLDMAKSELDTARDNIGDAESAYNLVKIPGTPLIKFAEGNNQLRIARGNLLLAHGHLNQAFALMMQGGN